MHVAHVNALKYKLTSYQIDPFADGPARHLTTGSVIDKKVIAGLLNAPLLGNDKYLQFIDERLECSKVIHGQAFSTISRIKRT